MKLLSSKTKIKHAHQTYFHNKLRFKKKFLFILIPLFYLLIAGGLLILLYAKNINYPDINFNPNADDAAWEDYYQHHQANHQPIDLNLAKNFFSEKQHSIMVNVTSKSQTITFQQLLAQVDNAWEHQFQLSITTDSAKNPLPSAFFSNVITNPAVLMNLTDDGTKWNPLQVPSEVNAINSSTLTLTTNLDATSFGIANNNFALTIKIGIKDAIPFDIKQLSAKFNPLQLTGIQLETQVNQFSQPLIKTIEKQFVALLAKIISCTPVEIKPEYYQIGLDNPTQAVNFSEHVVVKFHIISQSNPLNFFGTFNGQIDVTHVFYDLTQYSAVEKQLESTAYDVTVNNDVNNSDNNLSTAQVKQVKLDLIKRTSDIVQQYFKDKLPITTSDYQITISDLAAGDNIFNHQNGQTVGWKLTPNNNVALKGQLTAKLVIHGRNNKSIAMTCQKQDITIDGIWLQDDLNNHHLQFNEKKGEKPFSSFYKQTKLFNSLISDKDSLLHQIQYASYQPDANSFTGTLQWDWNIDKTWSEQLQAKISNGQIDSKNNFWTLLSKTESIYLMTQTEIVGNDFRIVDFQFQFYQSQYNDENKFLFSIGLPSNDHNRSVASDASLDFTNFSYQINCQIFN